MKTFFKSSFDFDTKEYELKLQHILYNAILITVIFMLSILSTVRFLENNFLQLSLDIAIILVSLIAMYYIRQERLNVYKVTPTLLIIFYVFVSFSFFNVNIYIGTSWYIVYLLAAFFLSGLRVGLITTVVSLLAVTILSFFSQEIDTFFHYFYSITPLMVSIIFLSLFEKRNSISRELLSQRNLLLEEEVHLKTKERLELLQKTHELAAIIDNSKIELYIVDFETDYYLHVNKGALDSLGYTYKEMLEKSIYEINPSLTTETVAHLKVLSKTESNIMNITEHIRKDGTIYSVQSQIHKIKYNQRDAYAIYDTKVSDTQKAQGEILRQKRILEHQAHYDTLTKLPNRILFFDRLSQAIAKSKRSHNELGVLFLDLDEFKEINDTLGHDVGDLVLIEIAKRLKKSLRDEDTVARLAGDEFLVIIENIHSKESVATLCQKILNTLSEAIKINKTNLYVTCSIGVSIYPDHTEDPKVLVKHADQAMYKAKHIGKNSFKFYD
jgi:diguanylate cyclase (GGDEF)-like protein/PAS domain S-box-containing protein